MGRLQYSAFCSLDGYTVDADGKFDWAMPDEEEHAAINDLERPVGTHSKPGGCTRRSRCGRPRASCTCSTGEVSALAGYSGTPLPVKLGIKPGCRVLLDSPPEGPDLGVLPDGVTLHRRQGGGRYDVVLLVAPSAARLRARWPRLIPVLGTAGRLWVCWPKRSSGVSTDLTEARVREFGLAEGLVDVKVCALDPTWSGLAFVRRLRDR